MTYVYENILHSIQLSSNVSDKLSSVTLIVALQLGLLMTSSVRRYDCTLLNVYIETLLLRMTKPR